MNNLHINKLWSSTIKISTQPVLCLGLFFKKIIEQKSLDFFSQFVASIFSTHSVFLQNEGTHRKEHLYKNASEKKQPKLS